MQISILCKSPASPPPPAWRLLPSGAALGSSAKQFSIRSPTPSCTRALADVRLWSVPSCFRAQGTGGLGLVMHSIARIHLARMFLGKIDKCVAHNEPRVMAWIPKMLQSPPIDITHALSRTLMRSNLLLCLSHKFLHN